MAIEQRPSHPRARIHRADAFDFMAKLPNKSVDLIVSSPPYFMGKEYDISDNLEDFLEHHERLLPLLNKVLKPTGNLCWQLGHHVRNGATVPLDSLAYMVFSKERAFLLRNRIIWTFDHGEHSKRRFSGRHETVLWFSKGEGYFFDLDSVRVPQKYPGKRHYRGPNKGEWSGNPLGKNPSDVWAIPHVKAGHVEKTAHPCQFPVALVQRLVRALCPPDGIVLDPFLGSGSAAVASLIEGRRFVGCEREETYVQIARERVAAVRNGTIRYRELSRPIYQPNGTEKVARVPPHFRTGADNEPENRQA